jgi:hypothetical protein
MAFPPLPSRLTVPAQTKHTRLLAVFGEKHKENRLRVALTQDVLQYELFRRTAPSGKREQWGSWTWGEVTTQDSSVRRGTLVGALSDGSVLTCEKTDDGDGHSLFSLWKDATRLRDLQTPYVGIYRSIAAVVHDRLCLRTEKEELVLLDPTRVGAEPQTVARFELVEGFLPFWLGSAPDRGLVVATGADPCVYDLDSGKQRFALQAPKNRVPRMVAFARDGATAVTSESPRGNKSKAAVFTVLEARSGKVLGELDAQKPFCRDAQFVAHGRMIATVSTDGTLALWDSETLALREQIKLDRANDYGYAPAVLPWDAHDAMIFVATDGVALLFAVDADGSASHEGETAGKGAARSPTRNTKERRTAKR